MNSDFKSIVVMPAFNAEKTLRETIRGIPSVLSSEIVLCDDGSTDNTAALSARLGVTTIRHRQNRGYGANQKTLYTYVRKKNPAIIIMVHPDNQYDTSILPEMVDRVVRGAADVVLGSRMRHARKNGMPWWKRAGNRFLTYLQNAAYGTALSEFHSGLRVFSSSLLDVMPYEAFSNDFVFDSEFLAWSLAHDFRVAELPAHCYYNDTVSSVNFTRSVVYGIETLHTLLRYRKGYYRTLTRP